MSYEGRVQAICQNGHLNGFDAHEEVMKCSLCGADMAWENAVDDTNCDSYGYISPEGFKSLLVKEAELKTCPTCGHSEIVTHPVYRIPTEEEHQKLRQYWDARSESFRPVPPRSSAAERTAY